MTYQPPARYQRAAICAVAAIVFGTAGVMLAQRASGLVNSAAIFWLGLVALLYFVLAGYLIFISVAFVRLLYTLTRNGLCIRWGTLTLRVPIESISAITPVADVTLPRKTLLGIPLPAWWPGTWRDVSFFAPMPQQAIIAQTVDTDIVISPKDPDSFIEAWQKRIPLGPTQQWAREAITRPIFDVPYRNSPSARWWAGCVIIAFLILVGIVSTLMPGTENHLLGLNTLTSLLITDGILVVISLILGTLLFKREPMAAYLLWFTAVLLQIGVWVAVQAM